MVKRHAKSIKREIATVNHTEDIVTISEFESQISKVIKEFDGDIVKLVNKVKSGELDYEVLKEVCKRLKLWRELETIVNKKYEDRIKELRRRK